MNPAHDGFPPEIREEPKNSRALPLISSASPAPPREFSTLQLWGETQANEAQRLPNDEICAWICRERYSVKANDNGLWHSSKQQEKTATSDAQP